MVRTPTEHVQHNGPGSNIKCPTQWSRLQRKMSNTMVPGPWCRTGYVGAKPIVRDMPCRSQGHSEKLDMLEPGPLCGICHVEAGTVWDISCWNRDHCVGYAMLEPGPCWSRFQYGMSHTMSLAPTWHVPRSGPGSNMKCPKQTGFKIMLHITLLAPECQAPQHCTDSAWPSFHIDACQWPSNLQIRMILLNYLLWATR